MTDQDYKDLEEAYYDALRDISDMKHTIRIMKACIDNMVSDGAKEPMVNGEPISSHTFWKV